MSQDKPKPLFDVYGGPRATNFGRTPPQKPCVNCGAPPEPVCSYCGTVVHSRSSARPTRTGANSYDLAARKSLPQQPPPA